MKRVVIILVVMAALAGMMVVGMRNHLVTQEENVRAAWAQVETVLQRRYDLIPNLVNSVKGYASHERGTFEEITRLRSQWAGASTAGEKVQAANELEGVLSRLLVVAENYPELKANQNFMALQDELAGTENRISVERRRFNEAVQAYNTYLRKFPASLVASFMGFQRKDVYFEATPHAETAPVVTF